MNLAKAVWEKSMSETRESLEDAEGAVSQGPCDTVKAELPEPQIPVVEPHIRRYSVQEGRRQVRIVRLSRRVTSARQTMNSEFIEGDEWGA